MVSSTSCSRSRFPLAVENSVGGTAFCLVTAIMGRSFPCCIKVLSYLLIIWNILLLAMSKNDQVHCTICQMCPQISAKFLDVDLRLRVWDHHATGGLNIQNFLDSSIVFSSSWFTELSAVYILSLECIGMPVAVYFAFIRTSLLKIFLYASLQCPPCLAISCCSPFHSVHLWPYGGAFGDRPLLLPVWITFRDGDSPCIFLSCHVRMNIFRHSSTSCSTSKIDNLCLFVQLLSESMLLLLCLLIALFEKSTCSAVAARRCHWPQSSIFGSFSTFSFKLMSCWHKVIACFMRVDFFTCPSSKVSRTCSSESLPKACDVSSQAWLNILRLSLYNSTLSKPLKFIVCVWVLLMLKSEKNLKHNLLPVSIGRLFLHWVSSKKKSSSSRIRSEERS